MDPVAHPADRERGTAAGRLLLGVAVALTAGAIGVGTWVLGSGDDPARQERATTVSSDLGAPQHAQPPVPVAPPPSDSSDSAG